jgi:hypothetical protein
MHVTHGFDDLVLDPARGEEEQRRVARVDALSDLLDDVVVDPVVGDFPASAPVIDPIATPIPGMKTSSPINVPQNVPPRAPAHLEARHPTGHDTAVCLTERALAAWRGPALSDFTDEPFAAADILRLEEARLRTLELRLETQLAAGDHTDVVP